MTTHTILYYSGTTGSHFTGRVFWWPAHLRTKFRLKHCGILLTYADEEETAKVLEDIRKGPRKSVKKTRKTRAMFARKEG